jgi:hypothetical protein
MNGTYSSMIVPIHIYTKSNHKPLVIKMTINLKFGTTLLILLFTLSLGMAHGDDDGHDSMVLEIEDESNEEHMSHDSGHSMSGESSLSHQLQMILPFTHLEEGHWLAGSLLFIMWISFIYVIFSFIKRTKF